MEKDPTSGPNITTNRSTKGLQKNFGKEENLNLVGECLCVCECAGADNLLTTGFTFRRHSKRSSLLSTNNVQEYDQLCYQKGVNIIFLGLGIVNFFM